jgi:phospholipase/carboxylesterase
MRALDASLSVPDHANDHDSSPADRLCRPPLFRFRRKKASAMMLTLSGPSRPPVAGGRPRRLVILLHGLGADGNDLIGLQQYWGRLVPDAEFIAPNAPFPCDGAPWGYQWFSVQDRSLPAILAGVRAAAPALDAFIDQEVKKRDLSDGDLALVGFSQGTMMALYVGLRRAAAAAGIVGYSGRLVAEDLLASELRSRPPVLLVHGTDDPVVPFSSLAHAEAALKGEGVPVETLVCPGVEHSISPEGLQRGGAFLRQVFSAPRG